MKPRVLVEIAVLALLYFAAAKLGLAVAYKGTVVSAVWPPAGIALAVVLLYGYRVLPGIFLGAFFANYLAHQPVLSAATIASGNTLETLCCTLLIHRVVKSVNPLEKTRDIVWLFLAAIVGTTVAATVGTMTLKIGHQLHNISFSYLWMTWWLGDLSGIVVLTPLILSWAEKPFFIWKRTESVRAGLALVFVFTVGHLTFGKWLPDAIPIAHLTLVPLILIAFLFNQKITAAGAFILSVTALFATLHGNGPFAGVEVQESLVYLQFFIANATITSLLLSTIVAERRAAASELESQKIQLQDQLTEKQAMLLEIHHRVKNNLQIVASLLSLQASHSKGDNVANVLSQSQSRIRSMALIHEKLYGSENLGRINLGEYIGDLARMLLETYGMAPDTVEMEIDCEDISVDIQKAVPCALILNEIISNSLKHAFVNNTASQKGHLKIRLTCPEKKYLLEISDNGPGIPKEIDPLRPTGSLGLKLVLLLVDQLNGTVRVDREHGTKFQIEFE